MRIQHNIMAMSAYRNYTNNVSAMKKNLEKLSSGYKINRAGDDAAGLAISEKMRAQITGLETAQKNAKDGISLVQTAEGALTEVHDMLNRMVELATQSANGTYDNETDRAQMQKEMDQLNSEINRIADSANFNGIKLLDGSMATTKIAAEEIGQGMQNVSEAGITHIADGVAADSPAVKTKFTLDLSQVSVTNKGTQPAITDLNSGTVTVTEGTAASKATISFSLAGASAAAAAASGGTVKISALGQDFEVAIGTATDVDATAMAKAVTDAMGTTINYKGVDFKVAVTGGAVTLTAAASGSTTIGTIDDVTVAAGKPVREDMTIEVSLGGNAPHTTLNGGGSITIGYNKTMTGAQIAEKFMENLGSTKELDIDGTTFTVSNDNGKLTFEMKEDPTTPYTSDLTAKLEVKDSAGNVIAKAGGESTNTDATPNVPNSNWKGAVINQGESIGVNILQNAKSAETRHYAQAEFDLSTLNGGDGVKDGTALKIGNETYVFAVGYDSKFKDMANVIDLTHKKATDTDLNEEASRVLSNVAKDNKMFLVTTDNVNGTIRLTERKDSGINYNVNNLQGDSVANLKDATAADWAGLIQEGTANPDAKPASESGGLMLQIGDTADPYNQLRVSINDCHVAALGLDKIKISDQESAQAAVDVIKDAINYVSDVRGTLGATQNRLDHTINNLSVMTENIQDAESTIRDVDVAEEMMAYTKNNILIQSAQAMLAQANQVPQGVLQLLG